MKLGLGVLTLVNVALTCFGASMAMMSPMLFDSGGQDDQLFVGGVLEHLRLPRRCFDLRVRALVISVAQVAAHCFVRSCHSTCVACRRFAVIFIRY